MILWSNLENVFKKKVKVFLNGVLMRVDYKFTLQNSEGNEIVVSSYFIGIDELEDRLDTEILNRKLTPAKVFVQGGKVITFGPLAISREGIHQKDDLLPWQEVKSIELKDGSLLVNKEGAWRNWCKVGLDKIPNLVIFLTIVDLFAKEKMVQSSPA